MNECEFFLDENPTKIAEMKLALRKFENAEAYVGISSDESLVQDLQNIKDSYDGDEEMLHIFMDKALVGVLEEYGFNKSMELYGKQPFWYA